MLIAIGLWGIVALGVLVVIVATLVYISWSQRGSDGAQAAARASISAAAMMTSLQFFAALAVLSLVLLALAGLVLFLDWRCRRRGE